MEVSTWGLSPHPGAQGLAIQLLPQVLKPHKGPGEASEMRTTVTYLGISLPALTEQLGKASGAAAWNG